MSDHWPAPGNAALRMFFMWVTDDFVLYTWSNVSSSTGFSGCFTNTKIADVHLISSLGFWVLVAKPGCRAEYAYVTKSTAPLRLLPLAYKSHGPWGTLGLPWAKTFHTRPCSSVLEKEHSCVASDKEGLGSPWQTSLDPPVAYLFPVAFVLYSLL